jgi:hypothetical protein
VLDEGAVEAIGVHSELLESSDLYKKLYRMQFGMKNAGKGVAVS